MFIYKKYHFEPRGQILPKMSFADISKKLKSDKKLNFNKYKGGNGWSYEEFYKKSSDKEADLFLCLENGLIYIPGENELFLYIGQMRRHKPDFKKQRTKQCYTF